MNPIRVVIVDDSTFVREGLVRLLDDPRVAVVGTASTGEELLENIDAWAPDVISLDLAMPGMGGMAALEQVMQTRPTPVIILSSHSGEGAPQTVEALSLGAVDCIDKEAHSLLDFQGLRSVLLDRILAVADSNVAAGRGASTARRRKRAGAKTSKSYDLAVFGASTGGPRAIEHVLGGVGAAVTAPIAVVQHMPKGFTGAFAERLDRALPLSVREGQDGELMRPGAVYIGPAGTHMRILRKNSAYVVELDDSPEDAPHRPSVDILFQSVARIAARRTVAVLLTGMGRDGAEGMSALKESGGYTIAQDAESCVVYGMPKAAVALDGVSESLALDDIGGRLGELLAPRVKDKSRDSKGSA